MLHFRWLEPFTLEWLHLKWKMHSLILLLNEKLWYYNVKRFQYKKGFWENIWFGTFFFIKMKRLVGIHAVHNTYNIGLRFFVLRSKLTTFYLLLVFLYTFLSIRISTIKNIKYHMVFSCWHVCWMNCCFS